jgi:hypothetical protein
MDRAISELARIRNALGQEVGEPWRRPRRRRSAGTPSSERVSGDPIGELCPKWDESLPQPQEKRTKFGAALRAPLSDTQVNSVYQVIWRPATFPETVNIDKLLRQFSPRYREPPIFPSRLT